jgi:ESS family glutamate:Na+ symporter
VFAHPSIALAGGLDLGILMATCGLVYGLISGILWVNVGVRAGWVPNNSSPAASRKDSVDDASNRVPIGFARISGDTLDPLLLQMIWLALAFGIGIGLQSLATWMAGLVESWWSGPARFVDPTSSAGAEVQDELSKRLGLQAMVGSFPLFIYTLFGGLVVRKGLHAVRQEQAIDRESINRLTSSAMDILVVSAIATLNLQAVATLLLPFTALFLAGVIWTALCLLVFSRWLLPREHWFELGLINYGMSTGTTATGFVLLRLVDPELESGAAEDYAMAAPLSSPFVGGGVMTIGLPLLLLERVPIGIASLVLCAVVATMLAVGRRWNARASGG